MEMEIISEQLIFTRYLYIKNRVEFSLFSSFIEKNIEKALFWAYELYYSGFEYELIELLWKIYYDLYAALNPSFHTYFVKKHEEWIFEKKEIIIALIIKNMIIRSCSLDTLLFIKINREIPNIESKKDFKKLLEERNYRDITKYILQTQEKEIPKLFKITLKYFSEKIKIKKEKEEEKFEYIKNNIKPQNILLSIVMSFYYLLLKYHKEKNLYIVFNDEEILLKNYKTIEITADINRAYKILPLVYSFEVEDNILFNLFNNDNDILHNDTTMNLLFEKELLKNAYYYDWLYYSSFSPLWLNRIKKYNGIIDYETKKVLFSDDEKEEEFYMQFNYEPDEQNTNIQEKSIKIIEIKNIRNEQIYREYRDKCILYNDNNNNDDDMDIDIVDVNNLTNNMNCLYVN